MTRNMNAGRGFSAHVLRAAAIVLAACASCRTMAALEPAEEYKLATEIGSLACHAEIEKDADGHVTRVYFSNHDMHKKQQPDKPGVNDEAFLKLAALPRLKSIKVVNQPITEKGFALVGRMPWLEEFWEEYAPKTISPDFVEPLAACRDLKILAIKHNFSVGAINMQKLPGFEKLETLVLDIASADRADVEFVLHCPNVKQLELHRTAMNNEDVAKILKALPKLETLWMKPFERLKLEERFNYNGLKAVAEHPKLALLSLQFKGALPLPFTGGLEHLLKAPSLQELNIYADVPENDPEMSKLREAHPKFKITGLLKPKAP